MLVCESCGIKLGPPRPCSHFEVGLPQVRTFHPGGDEPVHLHCAALTAPLPGDAYAVPGALSCTLDSLPHLHWPAVPQHGRWWRGPREGGVCPGCFVIELAGVSGSKVGFFVIMSDQERYYEPYFLARLLLMSLFTAAWTSKRKKGKNSKNLVIVVIVKRGSISDN